ncbi:uncharacterized protein LOC108468317 [Gossypium arboreum]|uniref:uncharacterized protein LOC108468317 n=1 Tax=Gossypium arboreum TaxID=29729 RepID=UPI0008191F36|nr:uncharacterized protein LOC108468317 [Gossypium arboreum]
MSSSGFSPAPPPVFNREGYHIWEIINSEAKPAPLRANPTVAQIRQHSNERTKRYKAMSCIQNSVSDVIFTRIMACESPKQAWDKLKEKFQGTERTRQQQLLNLRRDFENLKMKEEETVKQYSDRIMVVVNSIRLLGEQFSEVRFVEKRKGKQVDWRSIKKVPSKPKPDQPQTPLPTRERKPEKISLKQMVQENIQIAHTRPNQPQKLIAEARIAEEGSDKEEQVFTVSCSAAKRKATKGWLIDSGCTNHMTPNAAIFKSIDKSFKTRVKVGNGHYIKAEGKGDVLIDTPTVTKLVSNVVLVLEIDKILLSIAQSLEKGYSVVFKGKKCLISDPNGSKLMTVTMADKSFVMD